MFEVQGGSALCLCLCSSLPKFSCFLDTLHSGFLLFASK